jgi:PKD repeat protein
MSLELELVLTADNVITTKNNYITVNNNGMTANFNINILSARRKTVQFINTSSGNPDRCLWNFGDRTSSTLKYPIHNYHLSGTYNVTLTVYKNNTSATVTKQVTV